MNGNDQQKWERFQQLYSEFPEIGLAVDLSKTKVGPEVIRDFAPKLQKAFEAMDQLEAGAIANPDEKRMVGHYWLRNASLAPTQEIKKAITETLTDLKSFAHSVHSGTLQGSAVSRGAVGGIVAAARASSGADVRPSASTIARRRISWTKP